MGKKTTLDAGFVARAVAGIRYAFTGNGQWMGAGDAMQPVAPETKGRATDYPVMYNTGGVKPRRNDGISFDSLRYLADNYDLLRMVIESRKDKMAKIGWTIQPRDLAATNEDESRVKDKRIDAAIEFFRRPNKENGWSEWLRMLLEDLLVIDAPCIYPRKTLGGDLYALDLIDGATINRLLDDTGRTPQPPEMAYQQVLHGLPASGYTADELIYRPRNRRTHKVYGYSPVEQVISTVNIAMRRQAHQMGYYKDGSVPDAMIGVPDTWSADEIRRFQEYWDLLLSGESAERRKVRFLPGDLARNFIQTKEPPLKDMYDEWLARVICYCFNEDPSPFIAQVNRATAETAREQALAEGLEPLKDWVKSVIDDILSRYMDMPEFEFIWKDEVAKNPKEQAEIYATYINAGVLTVDEVRAEIGRDPLPEDQKQDESPEPVKESEKLGKSERPISEAETAELIRAFLLGQADDVIEQVRAMLGGIDITDVDAAQRIADIVADGLNFDAWHTLPAMIEPTLRKSASDAARIALLSVMPSPAVGMKTAIRSRAAAWAHKRAAEMVGMMYVGDMLVYNHNAEWQITEGTRSMIRQAVKDALESGDSVDELAARLKNSHAFSQSRARMIARTELARADGMGTFIGWDETGLVSGKEWLTAADDRVSEICNENGHAGVIGLHENFPSGELMPPSHPHCRCTVVPVLSDGRPSEKMGKAYNPNQLRDKNGRWTAGAAVSVSGSELGSFQDTKEFRKAAMQYARDNFVGKSYTNVNSGHDIAVTWQGVKHAASKANPVELAVMAKLDDLLSKAEYDGSMPDRKGRPDIIAAHRYRAVAKVGKETLGLALLFGSFQTAISTTTISLLMMNKSPFAV